MHRPHSSVPNARVLRCSAMGAGASADADAEAVLRRVIKEDAERAQRLLRRAEESLGFRTNVRNASEEFKDINDLLETELGPLPGRIFLSTYKCEVVQPGDPFHGSWGVSIWREKFMSQTGRSSSIRWP